MPDKFKQAFNEFLAAAQAVSDADYLHFNGGEETEHYRTYRPRLSAMLGNRYIRVVVETPGQRSVFGFVDTTNGDVLKAAGWKAPAKGARGNIYDDKTGCGRVRWTGIY